MVKSCCIDGCNEQNKPDKELRYFKFPKNRSTKQKWLKVIQTSRKIHSNSLICDRHFIETDYKLVHGRRTLKSSIVPTVFEFDESTPTVQQPETPKKRSSPRKRGVKLDESPVKNDTPKTPTCTDKDKEDKIEENDKEINGVQKDDKMEVDEPKESEDNLSPKDAATDPIAKINGKTDEETENNTPNDKDKSKSLLEAGSQDILTKTPQPSVIDNSNPDYEELIKETHVRTADLKLPEEAEIVTEAEKETSSDVVVLDNYDDKVREPVFISIPVSSVPGSATSPGGRSPDCLMVVESLQVDVDPACLLSHSDMEGMDGGDDAEGTEGMDGPGCSVRSTEPVSLLTSSDDDDVIIEEPNIDTVEVSDETDEDDLPLTRYLKTKKGLEEFEKNLKDLFWGTAKEYYCYSCSFTSKSKADLTHHMESHAKTSQIYVCAVCSFQSASKGQFARHKRKHKEEKRYKCHICDYRARHKMSLVYHVKMHTNKDKNMYHKCKMCDYKTDNRLQMHKHLQSKHQVKIYVCSLCNYSTKRQHDLKKHIKVRHSQRPKSDDEYVPGDGE